jgi:hypothetical protein
MKMERSMNTSESIYCFDKAINQNIIEGKLIEKLNDSIRGFKTTKDFNDTHINIDEKINAVSSFI